jgi:hypothetical protein
VIVNVSVASSKFKLKHKVGASGKLFRNCPIYVNTLLGNVSRCSWRPSGQCHRILETLGKYSNKLGPLGPFLSVTPNASNAFIGCVKITIKKESNISQ